MGDLLELVIGRWYDDLTSDDPERQASAFEESGWYWMADQMRAEVERTEDG